jgi:hemerythrin superfamily protein
VDAVRMLEQDHHQIELLFDQYDRAGPDEQPHLVERICLELDAHTRVEEEMFYPAVRAALGQDGVELVEEALSDHARATRLIQEIRDLRVSDPSVSPKFAMLMEIARQHVDEEESEMFPLVRANMEPQLGLLGEALEQQRRLFDASMDR